MTTIRNVSNPAAYGAEWDGESGTTYQLVNPRGTTSLLLGAKNDRTGGRWMTVSVTDPERFGLTSPPAKWATFLAVVRKYVEEPSERNDET
jgi:hypothetical protein